MRINLHLLLFTSLLFAIRFTFANPTTTSEAHSSLNSSALCQDDNFIKMVETSNSCFDYNAPASCGPALAGAGAIAGAFVGVAITGLEQHKLTKKATDNGTRSEKILDSDDARKEFLKDLKKVGYPEQSIRQFESDIETIAKAKAKALTKYDRAKQAVESQKQILEQNLKSGRIDNVTYEKELKVLNKPIYVDTEYHSGLYPITNTGPEHEKQVLRKGSFFGIVGAGVGAVLPTLVSWINRKICEGHFDYVNHDDLEVFNQYADVYQPCTAHINESHTAQILQLPKVDREKLFRTSPSLCKAFVEQGIRRLEALQKARAVLNGAIQCGIREIIVPYKIGDTEGTLQLTLEGNKVAMVGSFVPQSQLTGYNKTKFKSYLQNDLTWSSISTPNRIWGTAPGSAELLSNPTNIRQVLGNNPNCLKPLTDKEVEIPIYTARLYCAAGQQLIVADQLLGVALKTCRSYLTPAQQKMSDQKSGTN